MAKPVLKAVLDTNIFISAFAFPGGRADEALRLAFEARYQLFLSPAILAELANVLERKFAWDRPRTLEACRMLSEVAHVVRPKTRLAVLKDEPDNRILECALAGRADRIVSGDHHLLNLVQYQGIQIQTLAEFIAELGREA